MSDRIMNLKLEIGQVMLNVLSAYGPQVGCQLEEKFWSKLNEVVDSVPRGRDW